MNTRLCARDLVPAESGRTVAQSRWNRLAGRFVIPGVGNKRAAGAVLVAAAVVLSGCGAVEVEEITTTTTSVDPGGPVNPWTLPLEERPPLFDPCDIPIETVEAGVGKPIEANDYLRIDREGDVVSCGWRNSELSIGSLATWKSREQYLSDRMFEVVDSPKGIDGRSSLRFREAHNATDDACIDMYFTERGTVWLKVTLLGALMQFDGKNFASSCEVLDRVGKPILGTLPEGDY